MKPAPTTRRRRWPSPPKVLGGAWREPWSEGGTQNDGPGCPWPAPARPPRTVGVQRKRSWTHQPSNRKDCDQKDLRTGDHWEKGPAGPLGVLRYSRTPERNSSSNHFKQPSPRRNLTKTLPESFEATRQFAGPADRRGGGEEHDRESERIRRTDVGATTRHPRIFDGRVKRSRRRGRRENGPDGIAGRVRRGGLRR